MCPEQGLHGVKHLKLRLYIPGLGFQEWSTGHRAVLKEGGYLRNNYQIREGVGMIERVEWDSTGNMSP